ncbi:hypothetical protein [Mobilicoccus caccae]|uniref:hypothetical protein n=1 Tax=Mobilicoccus caccae TaxID=1859295 RepID=UPI0024E15A05|nr:hypothetical protein [Mobilicoccus caccae]
MDTDVVQRWTRSPVTMLTGVLAVVYGLGVAFGDSVGLTGERCRPGCGSERS